MRQADIAKLMELSEKLAALNVTRFKNFTTPFTPTNARQAILAFKGDVYESMEVAAYGKKEFDFAQAHVRILSGMYGVLKPLDLIQPYRLEMGRKLAIGKTRDLYSFWGSRLAELLDRELATHKTRVLINLASEEYAKAIDRNVLKTPVIDVVFKEKQKDRLKVVGLFAKQARGAMADFIIKNHIDEIKSLRDFTGRGYGYQPSLSDSQTLVFVRKTS